MTRGRIKRVREGSSEVAKGWGNQFIGIDTMLPVVSDQPERERRELLAQIRTAAPEALPALAHLLLGTPDAAPKTALLEVAKKSVSTGGAKEALVILADDSDPCIVEQTLELLTESVPELAVSVARRICHHPPHPGYVQATIVLARHAGQTVREGLIGLAQGPDQHLRRAALYVIGKHAYRGKEVLLVVRQAVESPDATIRRLGAEALRHQGAGTRQHILAERLVRDASPEVRMEAIKALVKTEHADAETLILPMIHEGHVEVANCAIDALGEVGTDRSVQALQELLRSSPGVTVARRSLRQIRERLGGSSP